MALSRPAKSVIIKKYGNRRLYDTRESRYITLVELAKMIREGADVRVVDAKTSEDLTQATLVQIILDSGGAAQLLPVDLLTQLVRMEDDALGEFFGRYLAYALDMYNQAKQGMQSFAPMSPFGANPLMSAAANMARMWGTSQPFSPPPSEPWQAAKPPAADTAQQHRETDIEALRRQVDELRSTLGNLADATDLAAKEKKANK